MGGTGGRQSRGILQNIEEGTTSMEEKRLMEADNVLLSTLEVLSA